MTLFCAICLYTTTGVANRAMTIIGGTARCHDHVDTDTNILAAIKDAVDDEIRRDVHGGP